MLMVNHLDVHDTFRLVDEVTKSPYQTSAPSVSGAIPLL